MSARAFRWHHDAAELKSGVCMGSVPLVNLISCLPAKNKSSRKFGFSIVTTLCLDRNLQQQEGIQTLDFCCDTIEQRDKWIISIDFMRTRAVYEDYSAKNISVQFPLKYPAEEDVEDAD